MKLNKWAVFLGLFFIFVTLTASSCERSKPVVGTVTGTYCHVQGDHSSNCLDNKTYRIDTDIEQGYSEVCPEYKIIVEVYYRYLKDCVYRKK